MAEYLSVHQPNGLKTEWPPGSATSYQAYANINRMTQPDMAIKMFVPPGTTVIKAYFTIGFNAEWSGTTSYCAACFGDIPDAMMETAQTDANELWMIDGTTGYTRQIGGYLNIVDDGFDALSSGGWLYIDLDTESSDMDLGIMFNASIIVDPIVYSEWYLSTNWDEYGDPLDSSVTPIPGVAPYTDPMLDAGAVYPPTWPTPYPWNEPFPYPFN